jgi:hypothetical protein
MYIARRVLQAAAIIDPRMAHVAFISMAREDASIGEEWCAALESNGIRCWMAPRDVSPGSYSESILTAIEGSAVVLLLISTSADESDHVEGTLEGLNENSISAVDRAGRPGLLRVGSHRNWLYTRALFGSGEKLKKKILREIARLPRSGAPDVTDQRYAEEAQKEIGAIHSHGCRSAIQSSRCGRRQAGPQCPSQCGIWHPLRQTDGPAPAPRCGHALPVGAGWHAPGNGGDGPIQ